jgi:hypothetical protein
MRVIVLKKKMSCGRFGELTMGDSIDLPVPLAKQLLDVKAVRLHEDEAKALQERRAESLKKDAKAKKASK